jgi:hypothetical protein
MKKTTNIQEWKLFLFKFFNTQTILLKLLKQQQESIKQSCQKNYVFL